MKATLLTILKYLLMLGCAALVMLLLFGLAVIMRWPWWVGVFLALAAVGLATAALFVRRLLLRRREQRFVQQVIEQDDDKYRHLAAAEQNQHKQLQAGWKEAVETVRRSHLKKHGNPLYVLPWYLVMGESGSGKSTAIGSARLSSPFGEVHHASGVSGTRNCDWWFFDQSIILDTAGRYALPVDPESDNDEWQKFLSLLVKYRRKEPINGLILTVAADKLLGGTPEALKQDALQLRRRLDELMRVMGIRFPVYLLVTKCDLVRGMTQFSTRVPEQSLDQAMGVVNRDLSTDGAGFVGYALASLAERLKELRLLMLNRHDAGPLGAEALLFPDEFLCLKPGLEALAGTAFQENRYQDTPLLRGLYFSSGRQEGTPYSHFLAGLGLIAEKEVLPETSRGLFLHDFFDQVLPRDRSLLAPTTRATHWQSLTRNLGLVSWMVLWVALSGLLSFSFVKNMAAIRSAGAVVEKAPELKGDFRSDLATADLYRRMILNVEQQNRNWWVPRFWLQESLRAEAALKARYCKQLQERFLVPFDRDLAGTVAGFGQATPDDNAGQYIVHLVRRINLLKLRLDGSNPAGLASRPLPSFMLASPPRPEEVENARKFGAQYLNYLEWRGNSAEIGSEVASLQALLQQVLLVKGADLHWLPDWANRQGIAPPLTLQSFWGGSHPLADEPIIPPACTRKGGELVSGFRSELKSAFPGPAYPDRDGADFQPWYRENCYDAWQRFAVAFPSGERRLRGAKEWQAAAELMATDRGAYFSFLNRAAAELESFGDVGGMPPLLQQIVRYRNLKGVGPAAGAASKAIEEGKKLTEKLGSVLGAGGSALGSAEARTAGAKACQEYQVCLASLAPGAKSRTQAYQMALQVFSEDSVVSKSPFYQATEVSGRLNGYLTGGGAEDAFGRLAGGPLSFLWSYAQRETACALQSQWEEMVLKEAQGATDPQALQYLLGQEGPVWKFVSGPLGPFVGWSPGRGYYSKGALGGAIPFEPAFFSFLARGAKAKLAALPAAATTAAKPGNAVTIKGLPTDANGDARVKPQSTRLELQCAAGSQQIENLNYPVTRTFTWAPDGCGDATFQIEIGELVLSKQYRGPQGFPAFLKDFPGGRHTFYPRDFPREKGELERMGVRFIRANYQFHGMLEGGGMGGASAVPVVGQIPRVIAKCWD